MVGLHIFWRNVNSSLEESLQLNVVCLKLFFFCQNTLGTTSDDQLKEKNEDLIYV